MARPGAVVVVAAVLFAVACNKTDSPGTVDGAPSADTTGAVTPDAPASSMMMMGTAGGTLETEGATLVVPAGALTAEVAISITKTAATGAFGNDPSSVYLLEPEGQTFTTPVTFTIHLAAAPGGGESVMWSKLGVADPTLITDYELRPTTVTGVDVSASNTHFSHVYAARFLAARQ